MADLFTLESIFTLLMLVLLQAVLGFDNLLYISLESKKVPADRQSFVRKLGIGLAIVLRLVLLFALVHAIQYFGKPFFSLHDNGILEGAFTFHSVIVLVGGAFIIFTAMKEIFHLIGDDDLEGSDRASSSSVKRAVTWIVVMNLIFSFDSILSAMALTDNMIIMGTAVVVSGIMMMYLADEVSRFLSRNRMYEILGLFILFIVGIMLVTEGGHLAHLTILGNPVEPMTKTTFYFVLTVLVLTDIVQGRYQRKLLAKKHDSYTRGS